jgi:predicted aconitase with swiveling domain
LVPGVGDAAGAFLSSYILYEAIKLGVPTSTLIRMVGNIALETVVGSIPLVGDVFDMAWKANKKNVALIHAALKHV